MKVTKNSLILQKKKKTLSPLKLHLNDEVLQKKLLSTRIVLFIKNNILKIE